MRTVRLDQLLVTRGLAESRAKAKAAIEAGGVTVNGAPAKAASQAVNDDAEIGYAAAHRWVGRGALKLERALDLWPVAVEGRVVLDVGASTGGFTEVCLDRGAARVFAVDVGYGQMHPKVAADPRVVNLERTDARELTSEIIPEAPSLVVCDASFIGLSKVLPAALELVGESAAASAASAFAGLAASFQKPEPVAAPQDMPFVSGNTVEAMVQAMLRPMLKDWLDANLPGIVEAQVRKEVERIARNAG